MSVQDIMNASECLCNGCEHTVYPQNTTYCSVKDETPLIRVHIPINRSSMFQSFYYGHPLLFTITVLCCVPDVQNMYAILLVKSKKLMFKRKEHSGGPISYTVSCCGRRGT